MSSSTFSRQPRHMSHHAPSSSSAPSQSSATPSASASASASVSASTVTAAPDSTSTPSSSTLPPVLDTQGNPLNPASTLRDATGREGSFKEWNRLADAMERFHSHFRWEYDNIYRNADGGYSHKGLNLDRFIREAEQLAHHLDMHHRIEEAYIFPLLAKKIPAFADGARTGAHINSHHKIHEGLAHYEKYLSDLKSNPTQYSAARLRETMDGFKDVLFTHLADEVRDLGAESMYRSGFTLDELKRFPM